MNDRLDITLAGETLSLLAERAVYWAAQRMLLIADPHFGKDGVFRRSGLAVPAGSDTDDLNRLDALLRRTGAEHLLILGDVTHAPPRSDEPMLARIERWRRSHAQLTVTALRGNHDQQPGPVLERVLAWHTGGLAVPPFSFRHEPEPDTTLYTICGHLHPVYQLRGPAGDRARLPAFHFARNIGVLPAFGGFTGGHPVTARPADRVFVTDGVAVFALPPP